MNNRDKVIRGLQEAVDWLSTETSLTVVDQWVVRDALALLKELSAFKDYFSSLYGTGLEVANYHMNGAMEPFDNFYESAEEYEDA